MGGCGGTVEKRDNVMSRRHPDKAERVELRYRCVRCGALPDEWCKQEAGGWYHHYLHASRFNAAYDDGALPLPDSRYPTPIIEYVIDPKTASPPRPLGRV